MTDAGLIASRRRLLLRDGLTFFVLTLTTVVLFVLTWLLFRSFTEHRAELAVRWAGRGEAAVGGAVIDILEARGEADRDPARQISEHIAEGVRPRPADRAEERRQAR